MSDTGLVLRRGPHVWVLEGLAALVASLIVAATVDIAVGVAVAVVALALLHHPVVVPVRPAGMVLTKRRKRRGIPWSDINEIRVNLGWRARSVEVFQMSSQSWLPVPAPVTSRILPGRRFARNVGRLSELAGLPVTTRRWGAAWVWPVAKAAVLTVLLSTLDPVNNWLPLAQPEAAGVPARCDLSPATADGLGVAGTATIVDSPLMRSAQACAQGRSPHPHHPGRAVRARRGPQRDRPRPSRL